MTSNPASPYHRRRRAWSRSPLPRLSRWLGGALATGSFLLTLSGQCSAQEYYRKDSIELEVDRSAGGETHVTFTRREGFQPAERLAIAVPVEVLKDEATTGAGVTPVLKLAFRPAEAEISASGALDSGAVADAISGVYKLVTAADLTKEQKARAEQLDVELNRVYGEVKPKLNAARAAELKDLQREWIHSVYTPDIEVEGREPADGEHWRQQADQAADRIKFLRDFASGRAASGPPSLRTQLASGEEAEAWPSVAEIARHMLVNTPKDSALWEKRARAFASDSDWPRCSVTIDEWAKATGLKLPAMDSLRGDVALAEDHPDAAVEAWNACIRVAAKDVDTRDKLSALLQKRNAWAEAAKVSEQRVKIEPTPDSLASLSVCSAVLQNWKLAGSTIRRASKLDATNALVGKTLPRIEHVEKNQAEIKKLEAAIAAAPKSIGPLIEHAIYFFDFDWPEISLKDADDALQLWGESRAALLEKGAALSALQRVSEADGLGLDLSQPNIKNSRILRALATLDVEIQTNGPTASLLGRRAHFLNAAKQFDLSAKDTGAALKLDANCDEALAARGEALSVTGNEWEAFADAKRATEINPKNALAWFVRGVIENKHRNFLPAVEALTKALELQPGDYNALVLRETSYRQLGRAAEANADAVLIKHSPLP